MLKSSQLPCEAPGKGECTADKRDGALLRAYKIIFDKGDHPGTAEEFLGKQADWRQKAMDSLPTIEFADKYGQENAGTMQAATQLAGKKSSGR